MKIKTGLIVLSLMAGAVAPAVAAQPPARTIQVEIQGFKFVPARVDAHVGDTIEWTNKDFAPHTATDAGGKWTTGTLKQGGVGRMVVKSPGTLSYRCYFHPQMPGSIVVMGNVVASPKTKR